MADLIRCVVDERLALSFRVVKHKMFRQFYQQVRHGGGMRGDRARRRYQGANLKEQEPMGLVLFKSGMTIADAELQQQLITRIRDTIGAITCYKDTMILARLPKTRSGKTLRKNLAPLIGPF
jgi:AMP-binding enzyme C-terminal domain